jgi:hypothetical protein
MQDNYTEQDVHDRAQAGAKEAELYWSRISRDLSLQNDGGTVKNSIIEDFPDIGEDNTRYVIEDIRETEDTITYGWAIREKSDDEIAYEVRLKRNALLKETDHYALTDVEMPESIRAYRSALRNLTSQPGFPRSTQWPIFPIE